MKDLPRIKEKYRVSMENINGISIVAVDELDLKYLIEQAEKLERYEKVAKKAMETGYE